MIVRAAFTAATERRVVPRPCVRACEHAAMLSRKVCVING
jgi:hypothetical protein